MDSEPQQFALMRRTPQDAVILASSYGSGRIVNELFESAGEKIGKKLDILAVKSGWGPTEATKQIEKMLGERDARKQSLNNLYTAFGEGSRDHGCDFSDIRKACRNLMRYTLPKESCGTQVAAFRGIVGLTTRYPHLRKIFLHFSDLEKAEDKKNAALELWKRIGNVDDKEWAFFSELAAACLSDGDITEMVEKTPPSKVVLITGEDGGLVECLLRKINCCDHFEVSCAAGVRYLGSILESSSFWSRINLNPDQYTAQKLFNVATRLTKDSGVEHEGPKDPNAEHFSDIEGVDMLICVIIAGVKEWLGPRPSNYLEEQHWSADFMELFKLLIMDNTRILFPRSRNRAVQEFKWFIEYKEGKVLRPTGDLEGIHPPESAQKEGETHQSTSDHGEETHQLDSTYSVQGLFNRFNNLMKFTEHSSTRAKVVDELSLTRNDLIVLIMGPTGAGKSTFIQYAAERNDVKVGHGLRSCTDDIRLFKAKQTSGDQNVVFVDTPGFDDTSGDDMRIFVKITEFLKRIRKRKIQLAGLIYMHRISDNRIGDTASSNLELFSSLCGGTAVSAVTFVTTVWPQVTIEVGVARETELKSMDNPILIKATYHRFDGTTNSALEITGTIVPGFPSPTPQVQEEMGDEKKSVGQMAPERQLKEKERSLFRRVFE